MHPRRAAAGLGVLVALSATSVAAAKPKPDPGPTGPSTTTPPFVLPVAEGVGIRSILSAGDSVPSADAPGGYTEVGVPDGLGVLSAQGPADHRAREPRAEQHRGHDRPA